MAYKSSINTGLPNIPDPPDPKFFGEFARIYNAIRNLTIAVDAYTGALGADPEYYDQTPPTSSLLSQNSLRIYAKAGVDISYGKMIHLYDVAGVLTMELASAVDVTKPMHGWCSTPGGVLTGEWGEVRLGGLCTSFNSLICGQTYYLSNTAGSISTTPGTSSQKIGFGLGPTSLFVQPQLI